MKILASVAAAAALLAAIPESDAHGFRHFGHRGGARFGFFIGVPLYAGPSYYYPPPAYYYYPPAVVYPPAPATYIQQQEPPPQYWYYCNSSDTYYPYTKNCPGGWTQVVPQPPAPSQP